MTARGPAKSDATALEQESRLAASIRERLHVEVADPDADLLESGIIDSLAFVELLLIVEQEFDVRVQVDDLDIDDLRTLRRIVTFIRARTTDEGGGADGS